MTFDYKARAAVKEEPRVEPPHRQTLTEWITDVCKVKETTRPFPIGFEIFTGCVDGLVVAEVNGHSTVFACPICDIGKKVIPSAKKWPGSYVSYTTEEMERIYEDRRMVAEGIRKGAGKMPVINTTDIGGPF